MKQQNPKYYLREVRRLDNLVDAKIEQINNLKSLMTQISPSVDSERVQTSKTNDKMAAGIAKIVDLETELNQEVVKLVELKRKIIKEIDSVPNEDHRLILTLRYLNYKTWEQIAVEMNYSYRNIHYLHKDALIEFESLHTFAY